MSKKASITSENQEQNELVRQLLDKSYNCVFNGEKEAALASVINAIILLKGESAVLGIIDQVKDNMRKRIDDMYNEESRGIDLKTALKMCDDLLQQDTILSERGDEDILVDAFQDGSSVICKRCNALIPVNRSEAHQLYWCDAIEVEDL